MTIQETAALLQTMDRVLLLTHVRPDGDTIGSAAALCRVLRDLGKTAYLLPNPGITETYERYAAPYWAEEGFTPDFVVAVDIAALSLLPENAKKYALTWLLTITPPTRALPRKAVCWRKWRPAARSSMRSLAL